MPTRAALTGPLAASAAPVATAASARRPVSRTALLCFEESRPQVAGIFQLRLLTGAALGHRVLFAAVSLRVGLAVIGWGLCVLFVYLFNGVSDVVEDRANGSRRPIARGALDPVRARTLAYAAGLSGLALCFEIDAFCGVCAAVFAAVGYAYSARPWSLKSTPRGVAGSVIVLGLTTYAVGFDAMNDGLPLDGRVVDVTLIGVAMALWMGLVGGATKDFGDVAGDVIAGRRNSVAAHGAASQRRRVYWSAGALSTAMLVAAFGFGRVDVAPAAVVLTVGSLLLARTCRRHGRTHGDSVAGVDRRAAKAPYRAFMATQYAVHLTALLTVVLIAL